MLKNYLSNKAILSDRRLNLPVIKYAVKGIKEGKLLSAFAPASSDISVNVQRFDAMAGQIVLNMFEASAMPEFIGLENPFIADFIAAVADIDAKAELTSAVLDCITRTAKEELGKLYGREDVTPQELEPIFHRMEGDLAGVSNVVYIWLAHDPGVQAALQRVRIPAMPPTRLSRPSMIPDGESDIAPMSTTPTTCADVSGASVSAFDSSFSCESQPSDSLLEDEELVEVSADRSVNGDGDGDDDGDDDEALEEVVDAYPTVFAVGDEEDGDEDWEDCDDDEDEDGPEDAPHSGGPN